MVHNPEPGTIFKGGIQLNQTLQEALNYSLQIIEHNIQALDYFPDRCPGETWTTVQKERIPGHWVDGFWVGLLWLTYAHTQDPNIESAARAWANRLAWLRHTTDTHDLGFIFYLSNVLGGRATDDNALLANAAEAAETFTQRYNHRGEYLQAWGKIDGPPHERGCINIDLMMNLSLLFWASEHTGEAKYAKIAACHARTSRLALVRPDGSIAQVADFNPDTGAFLRQETHQGLSHASCWSRGQAWALYGYADTYRRTGDEVFLFTARRLAEYTIQNAPDDLVPFWDYDSLDIPETYRDTSAAAVIAAGLLELADSETDPTLSQRWSEEAVAILMSLWENYSSRGTSVPAILLQGAVSVPHGQADHALIYGDYYFVEALTRLLTPKLKTKLL